MAAEQNAAGSSILIKPADVVKEITRGRPFEGADPLQQVMAGKPVVMQDRGDGVLKHDTQVEKQAEEAINSVLKR